MALTDRTVAVLKKSDKVQKNADGGGLYIVVTPTGKKTWQLIYRFKGKQTTLTLGTYPNLTLKQARLERDAAKELLLQGLDPGKEMKSESTLKTTSFEYIARAWHNEFKSKWTEKNAQVILR